MKELTLKATVENISQASAFIDAELEALDCPMKAQMQLDIAVDELFGNIAHYAYAPDTGDATLRFDFDAETGMVELAFIDSGVAYNPLEKADPDTSLSADERQIGGLGIFLVKKSVDDMRYERVNGQNILTIRKHIG